jgi:glycosyltransferase involved in cell wall biosynthesis
MRILHIITRMILGGAQENTMLSVLGQRDAGHETRLLTGPTTGPEGTLVPTLTGRGADVAVEPLLQRAVQPLTDWRARRALERRIRAYRPDVVHTHSSKAGVLGRWAAWRCGVPLVVHTIHGLPFHPYQSLWRNRLYIAAERFAARRCHRLAAVADAMTTQSLAAGVGAPAQYSTIYSGMEIEPFLDRTRDVAALRRRWGFEPEDIVLGKVARLFELKGHEFLFEAFARLAPQHPRLKLLLIGDGLWRGRFEAEARRRGLADRVRFAGLVPREELPAAMAATDFVAHCSLREGLARVLPQALLSEKPVVSFDVDGAREVVIPRETGYLVPPRDVGALVAALESVLAHPREARRLAAAGCRRCRKQFDWRRMVDRLLALYAEGLHGGRESPEAPPA